MQSEGQGGQTRRVLDRQDVRNVESAAGGTSDCCRHVGCTLELWACWPQCPQQLCHVQFGHSQCHEHGGLAVCECMECNEKKNGGSESVLGSQVM